MQSFLRGLRGVPRARLSEYFRKTQQLQNVSSQSYHGSQGRGGRWSTKESFAVTGRVLLAGIVGGFTALRIRDASVGQSGPATSAHHHCLQLRQVSLQRGPQDAPKADMLKQLPELLPPAHDLPPGHAADRDKSPLTRGAIADAAAIAAPAVVNLAVSVGRGFFIGQSEGSGAIIRSDGIILTNAHVVTGAAGTEKNRGKLLVTMSDGRTFDGEVLSFDTLSDIAVVKIYSSLPLPTVRLGSSRHVRPGDWVVALGSPLHLSNTVTVGIISCKDRKSTELGIRGARSDYLQTDAAINAGNSGGPLVNLDGEVVGINCMKALAADGVGFAIPIDSAIKVVEQLAKHGRVIRPFVGMKMLELNPAIASQLREQDPAFPPVETGVLIPQVIPGSPADRAGIRPGDVVVAFGGQKITSTREIFDALEDKVGVEFLVEVKRGHGRTVVLKVVTEEVTPDL